MRATAAASTKGHTKPETSNSMQGENSTLPNSSTSTSATTNTTATSNRHHRSWSTTFHLARGCAEFGTLVGLAVLSLVFLSKNVSFYDSSLQASTTYYGTAKTHSTSYDGESGGGGSSGMVHHDNHEKHDQILNRANQNQNHDTFQDDDSTTTKMMGSTTLSWWDAIANKLSLSTTTTMSTSILQQTTMGCSNLEELTLSPSLQAMWFEIDEYVAKFPDLPVSGGIFLYPRQRSILTVLLQALSVGRDVLQQQERQKRKEQQQLAQQQGGGKQLPQTLYKEPPLRLCESGFAAGHSAAMFLHVTPPDTEFYSFDLYDRRYQNQIWKFVILEVAGGGGASDASGGGTSTGPRRRRYKGDSCDSVPGMIPELNCDFLHSSSLCPTDVLDHVAYSSPCGGILLTTAAMHDLQDEDVYFQYPNGQWRQLRDQNCISNITCYTEAPVVSEQDFVFAPRGSVVAHKFCVAITTGKCSKVPIRPGMPCYVPGMKINDNAGGGGGGSKPWAAMEDSDKDEPQSNDDSNEQQKMEGGESTEEDESAEEGSSNEDEDEVEESAEDESEEESEEEESAEGSDEEEEEESAEGSDDDEEEEGSAEGSEDDEEEEGSAEGSDDDEEEEESAEGSGDDEEEEEESAEGSDDDEDEEEDGSSNEEDDLNRRNLRHDHYEKRGRQRRLDEDEMQQHQTPQASYYSTPSRDWRPILEKVLPVRMEKLCPSFQVPVPE